MKKRAAACHVCSGAENEGLPGVALCPCVEAALLHGTDRRTDNGGARTHAASQACLSPACPPRWHTERESKKTREKSVVHGPLFPAFHPFLTKPSEQVAARAESVCPLQRLHGMYRWQGDWKEGQRRWRFLHGCSKPPAWSLA